MLFGAHRFGDDDDDDDDDDGIVTRTRVPAKPASRRKLARILEEFSDGGPDGQEMLLIAQMLSNWWQAF
jgi:hypothetical protein